MATLRRVTRGMASGLGRWRAGVAGLAGAAAHQNYAYAFNATITTEVCKFRGLVEARRQQALAPPARPFASGSPTWLDKAEDLASSSMDFDSSVDPKETEKFGALAEEWWRPDGPFSMLHSMNPIRCRFIRQSLCAHFRLDPQQPEPLKGLRLVDVGCGGGLLTESLARMGAQVTGIDATERNIRVARLHAASDPLVAERVEYRTTTVEDMVAEGTEFDGVMCLEVVEHVRNPADFCSGLGSLARVGGKLVMSTMNRTPLSYGLAILGAEYIANIVPRGTHDWERFVTPEELTLMVEDGGMELCQMAGMTYNLLTRRWSLNDDLRVNYIASFVKGVQMEGALRTDSALSSSDTLPQPA